MRTDQDPGLITIADVLERGDIQTLFQPIVHLESRSIVGFEALSRGPAGSALESPAALISAATRSGRLGELDWLCRTRAMELATRSGFHPSLSWFINVEPAGLAIECPPHLRRSFDRARADLRVILELKQGELDGYVTRLLRATDQARTDAWGVALDDAGAQAGSMALLPFLHPDVVKLDLALVRSEPSPETADVTAAVLAYTERRQAAILAQGIETREHEARARVFGATYGQGYRYGPPAALPESVAVPRLPIPLRQRPAPLDGTTPFDSLAGIRSCEQAKMGDLAHIGEHLIRHCARDDDSAVLLVLFASEEEFRARRRVLDDLSRRNAFTVALVRDGRTRRESARYHVAPLDEDSALGREMAMIVVGPHYAGALLAREFDDTSVTTHADRYVDFLYTHDRDAVVTAARALLDHLK